MSIGALQGPLLTFYRACVIIYKIRDVFLLSLRNVGGNLGQGGRNMKNPYENLTFKDYLESEVATSKVVELLGEGLVKRSAPIAVNCIFELAKREEYGTISECIKDAVKKKIFGSNSAAFTSVILTTLMAYKSDPLFSPVFGDVVAALISIK